LTVDPRGVLRKKNNGTKRKGGGEGVREGGGSDSKGMKRGNGGERQSSESLGAQKASRKAFIERL